MKTAPLVSFGIVLAIFALLEVFCQGLTNDTDMLLHTASHVVFEGGLYQRWITVNSPVIYFIYAFPVLASVWFGMPSALALHGFTAELSALSLICCYYSLPKLPANERRAWLMAAAIALIAAPCAFHTYADREHYLFIFAMPWILQMLLRVPPTRFSIYIAMIGFLIKPYDLILLPALILLGGPRQWPLSQRLFSPSTLVNAVATSLYILLLITLFPDYLHTIVPIAYKTYASVTFPLKTRAVEAGWFMLAAMLPIALIRPAGLRLSFFGFIAATAVIYCFNAGWCYTQYLLCVPACLLCAALWLSNGLIRRAFAFVLCIAILGASGYGLGVDVDSTAETGNADNYNKISDEVKHALQQAAGKDFILLSANLWSTTIAALHGTPHSVYAYDDAPWPLAWVKQHPSDPASALIWQAAFVKPFIKALQDNPQAVIIADESPGQYSSLISMLKADKTVEEMLESYSRTLIIDRCEEEDSLECRFSVWRNNAIPH